MTNVTIVKKGTAESCPSCNAVKGSIHRNTYRVVDVGGRRATPVYTCMNCNTVYVEDPAPTVAVPTVRRAVAPEKPPAPLPGRDEPPAAKPVTVIDESPKVRAEGLPPSITREPIKSAAEVKWLLLKLAREDLERIAGELGITIDDETISVSDDIIAEIRTIRNATGLRASHAAARALMRYIDHHGLHIDESDMSTADKKRGARLINNLREALRLK